MNRKELVERLERLHIAMLQANQFGIGDALMDVIVKIAHTQTPISADGLKAMGFVKGVTGSFYHSSGLSWDSETIRFFYRKLPHITTLEQVAQLIELLGEDKEASK